MTSPYSLKSAKEDVDVRLVLQHETFQKLLGGRLLNIPIPELGGRVLDIGTGSGLWAAELAANYPKIEVVGIDNFPQPIIAAPSNCHFVSQDAEKEWQHVEEDKFDVIHTRLVPFHAKELPRVLLRCYEHLKPGGYIEMQDMLPPLRTDEAIGAPEHDSKVL